MDQGPLVIDQIDAGARFLVEFQKCYHLQDAFWLKEAESGEWYLYVASEQITDENFTVAYEEVIRITGVLKDPWFDPFQVKVIGVEDSLAKAVLDLHQRYPGQIATRFHGKSFGGISTEEVYVYASPIPVPA